MEQRLGACSFETFVILGRDGASKDSTRLAEFYGDTSTNKLDSADRESDPPEGTLSLSIKRHVRSTLQSRPALLQSGQSD